MNIITKTTPRKGSTADALAMRRFVNRQVSLVRAFAEGVAFVAIFAALILACAVM